MAQGAFQSVGSDELLARYALQRSHLRADHSPRPDLFMPATDLQLSVTLHIDLSDVQLWAVGKAVAAERQRILYGRADLPTRVCSVQRLHVIPAPFEGNPNHANLVGWPSEKSAQKSIAQELAANAIGKAAPIPPDPSRG